MASARQFRSGAMAMACIFPLLLAACGSSASAPSGGGGATGSSASNGSGSTAGSGSGGTGSGTSGGTTTLTGTVGNSGGGVVAATGSTIASGGSSLTHGALNNPVGITVLNNSAPGTGADNIVDANVLSNTPPSTAPVQANVLSNGQIISASVANPTSTKIPVVTPVVNGLPTIVAAVPGGAPLATTVSNVTHGNVTSAINTLPGGSSAITGTTAALTNGTPLAGATKPLNSALNVTVGNTELLGSSHTPAPVDVDVLTSKTIVKVTTSETNGLTHAHGLLPDLSPK